MVQTGMTVIGLGSMGMGIATSLLSAGHRVFGQDIDPGRQEAFAKAGGTIAPLAEAAAQSGTVISVVLNDRQTSEVLFGADGAAQHMAQGGVLLSCATIPPEAAVALGETAAEKGLLFLDAPISGGAKKAALGALSVMASGTPEAFAAAKPALDAMAATVHRMGDAPGAGSAMKSVNQLLAGVHIAAMAEALVYARAQGLDLGHVVEVIGQSAGASWMFNDRAPHVVEGDLTPRSAVAIWPKDLGIVLEAAERIGAVTPLTRAALDQFSQAVAAGDANLDDAAVARVYAKAAGVSLPGDE